MSEEHKETSCAARVEGALAGRVADLQRLLDSYRAGRTDDELGLLPDYALCLDYVAAGTFTGQREGYFRYQLSWGGPSDEFRFYVNPDFSCHRIEYWFLDWFDGAHRILSDGSMQLLLDVWSWLSDTGLASEAYEESEL